jgi:hypothetical protein
MNIILKSHKKKNNQEYIFTTGELEIGMLCYEFSEHFEIKTINSQNIELEPNLSVIIDDKGRIASIDIIKIEEVKYTPQEFLQIINPLFEEIKNTIMSFSIEKKNNLLNNKITFVTCIYDDLFGTEFGGRVNPSRKYLYGIESALKMNCPFVIFTWEKDIQRISEYYKEILSESEFNRRIKILPFDLHETPIREIIKIEKTKPQNVDLPGDRCFDVMFGKFLMLQKSIEKDFFNSENFFWIDAGLSSSALFPNKHLDRTVSEKQYSECFLFSPKVPLQLVNMSSEKIVLVKCNSVGYWFDINHLPESKGILWYIIGGIFGGKKDQVKEHCDTILNLFLYHINEHSMLYFEECIMTIDYAFNTNKYNILEFDTWHHEDSGEWAQPYIVGKKSFYKIFEKFNDL